MKRFLYLSITTVLLTLTLSATASAFMFGGDSKGATIKPTEDSEMTIRVLFQPRFDFGDLTTNTAGTLYESEGDLYFRRARLYVKGKLMKDLKYTITFEADKWDKTRNTNDVGLYYAFLRYHHSDELNVEIGKHKLPYSRVSLTSSSKQLIIDSPESVNEAKSLFGSYGQFMLMADGKLSIIDEGTIRYYAALADGLTTGDTVTNGDTVRSAGALFVGRVEISPAGYIEKKRSDAHLGEGQHLTLGINYAFQNSMEFDAVTYTQDSRLWGFDISAHLEELSLQFEYNSIKEEINDPGIPDVEPRGWYAQAGYYISEQDIEPVVRYESFDQNSNINASKEEIITVGLNWYPKGHTLKVGANLAHTEYELNATGQPTNDNSSNVFKIQGQFYF